jgi:hypothetical protein
MCVPASWTVKQGGIDSAAGTFFGDGIKLSYDLGLNSDPLPSPEGGSGYSELPTVIDGKVAREIAYSIPKAGKHYQGLHVPVVRMSPRGAIKLTLIMESSSSDLKARANAIFQTVHFK